jgi:hypothetical protein
MTACLHGMTHASAHVLTATVIAVLADRITWHDTGLCAEQSSYHSHAFGPFRSSFLWSDDTAGADDPLNATAVTCLVNQDNMGCSCI